MTDPDAASDIAASEIAASDIAPDASTVDAPPFPPPLRTLAVAPDIDAAEPPAHQCGERVDDFELVRLLGAGSFGRVFLARQISLNRLVALKITAGQGDEARTLARLEHEHIVGVYSEIVKPQSGLRLLCMQYVPGTTLAHMIEVLQQQERRVERPGHPRRH